MKHKVGDIVQVIKTKKELFAENMYRGKADVRTIAKVVALSEAVDEIALSTDGNENDTPLFNLNSWWIKSSSVIPAEHQAVPVAQKESLNNHEPKPIRNDHPAVWDLVLVDIKERDENGEKKYKTRLQPFNGRDALVDAYQEALDLVVYLRQAIYERKEKNKYVVITDDPVKPITEEQIKSTKKWLDTPTFVSEFCSCSGAVTVYEDSTGIFRCRDCVKRIRKNN